MIGKYRFLLASMTLILLLSVCAGVWSAADGIATLQKQILELEDQISEFEAKREELIAEGDELSLKIDSLKMQSKSGLGIIGRYKLSRKLRKAQALTDDIQDLEKQVYKVEVDLEGKKKELEREYDSQIVFLLEKLNGNAQATERGEMLEKLKEYRAAREKLKEPEKDDLGSLERLDIAEIEIHEYDGPQEIREKADLINDFATKMQNRIDMLSTRANKLEVELRTRERLGEFAEEINFFGERISREEVVSESGKEAASDSGTEIVNGGQKDDTEPLTETAVTEPIDRGATFTNGDKNYVPEVGVTEPITDPPAKTEETEIALIQPSETPDRIVLERNGVSASFATISLTQIRKEIELLHKQGQDLGKELVLLKEKADSFYKKAEEIEKPETSKGGEKETER